MTDYLQNILKSVYMLLKPSAAGCTAFQQTQISQLLDGLKAKKSQYFCRQDAHTFYLVFKSPWKLFFPTLLLQLKTVFCSYMRAVSILYLPVSLWWVWSGCWIKKNIWALQNQTSRSEFTLVYQEHKTCPVFYANLKLGLFVARKGKSMRSAWVFFCLSSPCSNIFQVTDLVELLMIMIINSSANQSFLSSKRNVERLQCEVKADKSTQNLTVLKRF